MNRPLTQDECDMLLGKGDYLETPLTLAADIAKPFEGLSLNPYHDPVGFPTIGYGHLLSRDAWADLNRWSGISEDEAHDLLEADMQIAYKAVNRLVKVDLTDNQSAALIDFAFNCGAGNLQASTLLKKLNRGDYDGAANEFTRWIYAAGQKLPGLVRRRQAEKDCFLSP